MKVDLKHDDGCYKRHSDSLLVHLVHSSLGMPSAESKIE